MVFSKLEIMKFFIILQIMCVHCLNALSAKFSLEGEIINMKDDLFVNISYASLNRGLYTEVRLDSILVSHGIFHIDGEIPELTSATIEIKGKRYRFYIEPSNIKLTIDIQKPYIHLCGTSIDNEYKESQTFFQQNDSILYAKYDYYCSHPYELKKGKEDTFTSYLHLCFKREQLLLDFCKNHPYYKIVPDLLCQALEIDWQKNLPAIGMIESEFLTLSEVVRVSLLGKLLASKIREYTKSKRCIDKPIGSEAPDFLRVTTKGDTIQLGRFRDRKNVILLFFNSLVDDVSNIFNKLQDMRGEKDFVIIGIDAKIDVPWRKHFYDNQEFPFPVIRDKWNDDLFKIREWDIGSLFPGEEVPYYLLIDKRGIIINKGHIDRNHVGSPMLQI